MKRKLLFILLTLLILVGLSACSGVDEPAMAVELYHQALVDKEEEVLINRSCADWESQALQDLDSFVSVETELVDVSCHTISQEDDTARVTCEGGISASYQGEPTEFPLSGRTYIVVREGGEWRMCGYE